MRGTAFLLASGLVVASALLVRAADAKDPIAGVTLADVSGTERDVAALASGRATVVVFVGAECPRTPRYAERIAALAARGSSRGVSVFAVDPNATDTAASVRALELRVPVLLDPGQTLADRLGVKAVPCAVVLDARHAVRYRGPIDDNKVESLVRHRFVDEAVEAVLAGRPVATESAPVEGCVVRRTTAPATRPTVTWSGQIAKLVHESCTPCHRPGQVAPFSLVTYEQARSWAQDAKAVTAARTMPPWKATEGGPFRDARILGDEQIALIARWADEGAPRGDPAQEPPAPSFAPDGWALGQPDLVLEGPEYEVPATGDDEYRCYVLPTKLGEDRWVSAVEIRPGNRSVVHHVLGYVDRTGISKVLDDRDPLPGYRSPGTSPGFPPDGEMGGWAPGNQPYALPQGVGRLLPKGSRVVIQVHYHKNGKVEKDRTSIGLHFARGPIDRPLEWIQMVDTRFRVPPGAKHHVVTKTRTIKKAIDVLAVMPHAHLIAREARLVAELPDGTKRVLVGVSDWDFNWQDIYHFTQPVRLPAGTRLTGTMSYDNSEENPSNPNHPPQAMGWGEQTTDEMFLFYVAYVDAKDPPAPAAPAKKTWR